MNAKRRRDQRGGAVVEMALMMPWIAFLFVGIFDFGVYSYSAIATQSAARATAINVASQGGDTTNACAYAQGEMKQMLNADLITSSGCVALASVNDSNPLGQCVAILSNTASSPCGLSGVTCADCALNTSASSAVAVITYRGVQMVPIPGILTDKFQMTRIAEARIIQ